MSVEVVPWERAGGPNECSHGYAEGVPCQRCADESEEPKEVVMGDEGVKFDIEAFFSGPGVVALRNRFAGNKVSFGSSWDDVTQDEALKRAIADRLILDGVWKIECSVRCQDDQDDHVYFQWSEGKLFIEGYPTEPTEDGPAQKTGRSYAYQEVQTAGMAGVGTHAWDVVWDVCSLDEPRVHLGTLAEKIGSMVLERLGHPPGSPSVSKEEAEELMERAKMLME